MPKLIVRLLAFFSKEINEVRRQPRLLLSLLLGPFLVLLLFGIGYRSQRPPLRIALVIPPELQDDPRIERVQDVLADNFELVSVHTDSEPALRELRRGQVEVVEVLPGDVEGYLQAGEQAPLRFIYNEINPQNEQYYQYSGYAQVDAINQIFLMESIEQLQTDSQSIGEMLDETRGVLDEIEANPDEVDPDAAGATLRDTGDVLGVIAASPALPALAMAGGGASQDSSEQILALRDELVALEEDVSAGDTAGLQAHTADLREQVDEVDATVSYLAGIPSNVFVSPLEQTYENLSGQALSLMIFFAPGVAALILQHIAVTLGALSLVRERYRGSLEFFGVAPVSMLQVLIGKYLAYLVFTGLIAALLVALMIFGLGVPFMGNPWAFAGFLALFLLAAIGEGLLISTISNSDTQAVQLAMLVLLLSIFFSGFILPLNNFVAPIDRVGYLVPMTFGMQGMQDVMLLGRFPAQGAWLGLGVMSAVTFVLVVAFGRGMFRRPV